jgi:hypothetical protein
MVLPPPIITTIPSAPIANAPLNNTAVRAPGITDRQAAYLVQAVVAPSIFFGALPPKRK